MRRAAPLRHDPSATAPVDTVIRGAVDDVADVGTGLSAASIVAPNRRARLTSLETVPPGGPEKLTVAYETPGYVDFEPGRTYVLALAGDVCAAALALAGDDVQLPGNGTEPFATFAAESLGRPIRDFYGIRAPLAEDP